MVNLKFQARFCIGCLIPLTISKNLQAILKVYYWKLLFFTNKGKYLRSSKAFMYMSSIVVTWFLEFFFCLCSLLVQFITQNTKNKCLHCIWKKFLQIWCDSPRSPESVLSTFIYHYQCLNRHLECWLGVSNRIKPYWLHSRITPKLDYY